MYSHLDNLKETLIANDNTDFETHYNVSIQLIGIVQKLQEEIVILRRELKKLKKELTR